MASARATENRLVFAQVQTEAKSGEITAIPVLPERTAIAGCVITIDATGCRYEIADRIVKKGADYVFSLKGNQETLHEEVKEYWDMLDFNKSAAQAPYITFRAASTYEEKHGRKETRGCAVSGGADRLVKQFPQWKSVKSIGGAESTRDAGDGGKTGRRYFISSLSADEELSARTVRPHWGIENRTHYMLDVLYREDACRDWSPRALGLIRKIALTVAPAQKFSGHFFRGPPRIPLSVQGYGLTPN